MPGVKRREQKSRLSSYSVVMSTIVPVFSASTIPPGFPNSPGAVDQYRNQYQTASDRYIPIPADRLVLGNGRLVESSAWIRSAERRKTAKVLNLRL